MLVLFAICMVIATICLIIVTTILILERERNGSSGFASGYDNSRANTTRKHKKVSYLDRKLRKG